MHGDPLILSRLQFAFVIAFHIIFPALTVGLASYIAVLEGLYLARSDARYLRASKFWLRIFAVTFGMGVVSGIVMPFQFGTNWSRFSDAAASVIGSLMAYEVLTAFYLEAAFLGVLLFGRKLVPQWAHVFSAVMVALGTLMSSFWILAVNSWMQTPQGHVVVDGRFEPVSMLAVLFTPSFPYRLSHTVIAFLVTSGFVILAVAAGFLRQRRHVEESRVMVKMSLAFLSIMVPLQIVVGDLHGLNTLKHQPAKLAAIEGHWENHPGEGVPLILFGWPDMQAETTRWKIEVPRAGSLLLTHTWDGTIPALKDFAPQDRPNSTVVFWCFRIMVGLGFLMIALALFGLWLRRGRRLYQSRPFLRFTLLMAPAGLIALLAGWMTTEIGRQPWIIHGVMRTADAVSAHSATQLGISLALFVVVYFAVFGAGTVYMLRLIRKGPVVDEALHPVEGGPGQSRSPARPLSAATDDSQGAGMVTDATGG